jgi:hypothetical protein
LPGRILPSEKSSTGIIDILKKVKDVDNRMDIAKDMIEQFKREDIKFDYENFINSVK